MTIHETNFSRAPKIIAQGGEVTERRGKKYKVRTEREKDGFSLNP